MSMLFSNQKLKRGLSLVLLLLLFITPILVEAQQDSTVYQIDENLLIETKWRYTYTLQVEANTIIHKADKGYDYYLHLKYDYTYEHFLNGRTARGTWSLSDNELFYNFRNIKKFRIVEVTNDVFVLEFNQPNSKGTYQYHFVRVNSKEAPFIKPLNELPDVLLEADGLVAINSKEERKKQRERRKKKLAKSKPKKNGKDSEKEPEKQPTFINVELVGGGFYGGVDPVQRDYIRIKSTGRLIKEFKSKQRGLIVTKKDISREELEEFMEFVISKNFFDFERIYDCQSEMCQIRKRKKPTPIPLRLAIAYGTRKKVITITIWGKDSRNMKYLDYPPGLDDIIKYIQLMANSYDNNS